MFKIGDRVWCSYRGAWGKIIDIRVGNLYPIRVCFEGKTEDETDDYTIDGRYSNDRARTLFFEELQIPLSALERPRFRTKEDGTYYFVNSYGVVSFTTELFTVADDKRFEVGNYFETEEEAELSEFYELFNRNRR